MEKRSRRVLWLINHNTLRNFEVPLLLELGYEVFTPKIFPNNVGNISASVDYKFDQYLTLPKAILDLLNTHYFYNDPWSEQLTVEINQYFGTVITSCFPVMINHVVRKFSGRILLRAFGLAGKNTYADFFQNNCEPDVVQNNSFNHEAIWFAPSYKHISINEPKWIQEMTRTLPIGLPEQVNKYKNTWNGSVNKLLFVCSRINAIKECKQLYNTFVENFGDLPHSIAGAQPVPVTDYNVLGFIQAEEYRKIMQNYKVMFYHSREERHLHYHPLEALTYGMPIIFMTGGMLDYLSNKALPGRCETFQEARNKIGRIIAGDTAFIESIRSTQEAILNTFSPDYIKKQWELFFGTAIV